MKTAELLDLALAVSLVVSTRCKPDGINTADML